MNKINKEDLHRLERVEGYTLMQEMDRINKSTNKIKNKNKKGQIKMKTEKIKFKIEELHGTAQSFQSGLTRMSFKVKINDNRMKTPYSFPVLINHERITKQKLIAEIIIDYIESARYCYSFNHFENTTDYQDFSDYFGYEKIGEIMEVVNHLKRCKKLLNSLILTEKDRDLIDDYRDDEDGNIDKISALIKKHFDVLFISDYINK